jgi:hypothetical protein
MVSKKSKVLYIPFTQLKYRGKKMGEYNLEEIKALLDASGLSQPEIMERLVSRRDAVCSNDCREGCNQACERECTTCRRGCANSKREGS